MKWTLLIALLIGVVLLWLMTPNATLWLLGDRLSYMKDDLPKMGLLGDTFGSANALFSALAFGGMIVTLYYQRQELKAQRKELELQRKLLEKEALALTASATVHTKTLKLLIEQAKISATSSVAQMYGSMVAGSEEKMHGYLSAPASQWLELARNGDPCARATFYAIELERRLTMILGFNLLDTYEQLERQNKDGSE